VAYSKRVRLSSAQRCDPTRDARTWTLVDSSNHQIDRITAEAKASDVPVAITIDCIHSAGVHLEGDLVLVPRSRPGRRNSKPEQSSPEGHPVRLVGE